MVKGGRIVGLYLQEGGITELPEAIGTLTALPVEIASLQELRILSIADNQLQNISGVIENNIFTRKVEDRFMGKDCEVIPDLNVLFVNPAEAHFRRKPDGPIMDAGANISPPSVIRKAGT